MAEDDQQSNLAVANGQEAEKKVQPRQNVSFRPLRGLPEIVRLGSPFFNGRAVINTATIDNESLVDGSSATIRQNSEIILGGRGLKIIDEWEIEREGRSSLLFSKIRSQTDGQVILALADIIGGSLEDGESVGLGFFASGISGRIRMLRFVFKYEDADKDDKDKSSKKLGDNGNSQDEGTGSSGGPVDTVMESLGDTMGGIAGALGSGASSSGGVKTMSNSGTSSSLGGNVSAVGTIQQAQQAQNDYDDDVSSETSEQETSGQIISSTTEVAGGTQTISQGGTVEQARTTEVSSGGTVSATQGATVSGTVAIPQGRSISGTVGVTGGVVGGSAAVSGTASVSGGGASTVSVSSAPQAGGGSATVQGTLESQANVTGGAEVRTQGQAATEGGANVQTQVSGTVNINRVPFAGIQGTTGPGSVQSGATVGTAALGLNLGVSGTARGPANQPKAPAPLGQRPSQINAPAGQAGAGALSAAPQAQQKAHTSATKPSLSGSAQKKQNSTPEGEAKIGGIDAAGSDRLPAPAEKPLATPSPAVQEMINKLAEREKSSGNLNLPVAGRGKGPGGAPQAAGNISTASGIGKASDSATTGASNSQGGSASDKSQESSSAPVQDRKPGTSSQGPGDSKNPLGAGQPLAKPENSEPDSEQQENSDEQPGQPPLKFPSGDKALKKPESALNDVAGKVIGGVTSKFWWWGFTSAAGTFFTGLDFFLGAIIMGRYWSKHRRIPKAFPMKAWQKVITVLAYFLPFVWASLFIGIIFYAGCNFPPPPFPPVLKFTGVCQSVNNVAGGLGTSSLTLNNPATNPTTVTGACVAPLSGDASVAYMSNTCFGSASANAATTAAIIAAHESGGNPTIPSGSDVCRDANGNKVMVPNTSGQQVPASVSFGLFQINITAHQISGLNCPAAFSYPANVAVKEYDANNHQCTIINQALYNSCVQAAEDPAQNINAACQISANGTNWNAWKADINACGITSN